jgi:hypothetical protein
VRDYDQGIGNSEMGFRIEKKKRNRKSKKKRIEKRRAKDF